MIVEISKTVRIEDHPPRKRAKATEELLDNRVTAKHYQVGAPDSMGMKIELGKQMDYIDWRCDPEDHDFSVYQLGKDAEGFERWLNKGTHPTLDKAKAAANKL